MQHIFENHLNWKLIQGNIDSKDKKFIAIVRHPVDRWIAGVAEQKKSYEDTEHFLKEELILSLINKSPLDGHTTYQSKYFKGRESLILFKLDHIDKLWDWFEEHDFKVPRDIHLNKHEDDDLKNKIYNNIKETLRVHPYLVLKILEKYAEDLKYYEGAI